MKQTKPRSEILALLRGAREPQSAEELYERMAEPRPALSTVYRNLERFLSEGLIKKEVFGDGVARYTGMGGHGGHFLVCTGCEARVKLDGCPLHGLEEVLGDETGYQIEGHSLTIYGKCPVCRKKEAGTGKT